MLTPILSLWKNSSEGKKYLLLKKNVLNYGGSSTSGWAYIMRNKIN